MGPGCPPITRGRKPDIGGSTIVKETYLEGWNNRGTKRIGIGVYFGGVLTGAIRIRVGAQPREDDIGESENSWREGEKQRERERDDGACEPSMAKEKWHHISSSKWVIKAKR